MEEIYIIKAEIWGGTGTFKKTQVELAEFLMQPGVRLISVNDRGGSTYPRRPKQKSK